MGSLALQQVSVWLDDQAPEQGAFAHALEWASRLNLPLHALAPAPAGAGQRGSDPWALEACAAACARHGVAWDACVWQGPLGAGIEEFVRPVELCVFGNTLPAPLKGELLRRSLDSAGTLPLVCSRSWQPISRVLVVPDAHDPSDHFLDTVACVCRTLDVTPVVLTLARSQRGGGRGQRLAVDRFAAHHLPAEFDLLVGCDLGTAVARLVRWRRCAHVFVERPHGPAWWRWLRRDPLRQLLDLSEALTFLALPGTGRPQSLPTESYAPRDPAPGQTRAPGETGAFPRQ